MTLEIWFIAQSYLKLKASCLDVDSNFVRDENIFPYDH